jgi:hypothetical protein
VQEREVVLAAGPNARVEFDFSGGRGFAGSVKTSEGEPMPGVRMQYVLTLASGERQGGHMETDDTGHFSAEDLDAVAISKLEIDQRGYAPFVQTDVPLPAEKMQIVLKPAGVVRVKVAAGPDTNWRVGLMRADAWSRGAYADQYMSTPAGDERYVPGGEPIDLLPPNDARFRVIASGMGGALAVSEPFSWSAAESSIKEITLTPKATGTLSGTLNGASGKVEIIATNTTLPSSAGQTEFKVETSGSNFELGSLPPGDYMVQAGGEAYSATATNVEIKPGGTTRVTLSPEALAEVTGVATISGQPLRGARVEMVSETDPSAKKRETQTNATGQFALQDVSPDSYLVRIEGESGGKKIEGQKQVAVARGKASEPVSIDLTPARTVSFQIPAQLNLAPGSDVSFSNNESHELIKIRWNGTQAEGELPAGKYEVWRGDQPTAKAEVTAGGAVMFTP